MGKEQRHQQRDGEGEADTDRLITEALGTYSGDGQVDDATGGDAGAEEKFGHEARPRGEDGAQAPRIGPA